MIRFISQFSRVILGLVFILSGVIKLNDPTGFSYKLDEYFSVFAEDFQGKKAEVEFTLNQGPSGANLQDKFNTQTPEAFVGITADNWERVDSFNGQDTLFYKTSLVVSVTGLQDKSLEIALDSGATSTIVFSSLANGETLVNQEMAIEAGQVFNKSITLDLKNKVSEDSFLVAFFEGLKPYALYFGIFMSWLEAVLGFALLIGWQKNFTLFVTVLITAFFTFLTWYSWEYNKVTDCGCFGDALPMNPEESFYKNLVIFGLIFLIYAGKKYIKPIFSNPFAVKFLTVLTLMLVGFSAYCWYYLPVKDFLHYAEGSRIQENMVVPEGKRESDWKVITYVYKDSTGAEFEVKFDTDKGSFEPAFENGWKYVKVKSEEIIEEAYEPPVHDFRFYDTEDQDHIDEFFEDKTKLLVVMHDLKKSNIDAVKKLNEIAIKWKEKGYGFWVLTSSEPAVAEEFRHKHQLSEFEFHFGDNTNLKSIIRSNPGLLLITEGDYIKRVWPATRLPSIEKTLKLAGD
jgi:uncharacterized membrane protein YphA (DoxX/SURF4 family)